MLLTIILVPPDYREQACNLWESVVPDELEESVRDALTEAMLQEVKHPANAVQRAAADALAHLLDGRGPDAAATATAALLALYREKLPVHNFNSIMTDRKTLQQIHIIFFTYLK